MEKGMEVRVEYLEKRMDQVESKIDGLGEIKTRLAVIADRLESRRAVRIAVINGVVAVLVALVALFKA